MRKFQGQPWVAKKAEGGVPSQMPGPYRNALAQIAAGEPMGIPINQSKARQMQPSVSPRMMGSGDSGGAMAAVSQAIPALMRLLKSKTAPATQRKKGGGQVVKGKTKNTATPQIPKGTPNKTGMKTTPAYKKGGSMKMKGC